MVSVVSALEAVGKRVTSGVRIGAPALLAVGVLLSALVVAAQDKTIPPSTATVLLDGGGWKIDDRRVRILSAEFDYARLPREVWSDRIQLLRHTGFNALTIPVCWAQHEREPGRADFTGRRDLGEVLDLCSRQRLWAVVRAGPWIGGDWGLGGLPPWLLIDGRRVRMSDPGFLEATDRWFQQLAPIVASRQIGRGGPVIAVDVDGGNLGPGFISDPAYPAGLEASLRRLGIAVPIVRSNPGDELEDDRPGKALDRRLRGLRRAVVPLGEPATWGKADYERDRSALLARLLAGNIDWIDCRRVLGGTNFGFDAAEGLSARHDGGAPIDRDGGPRPAYYSLKSLLLQARDWGPVLANAQSVATTVTTGAGLALPARRFRSEEGELLFLSNPWPVRQDVALTLDPSSATTESLGLPPLGILPVVRNRLLGPGLSIDAAAVPLLDGGTIDDRHILVAASDARATHAIVFATERPPVPELGAESFRLTSGGCVLAIAGGEDGRPRDYRFVAGEPLQVVAVTPREFDRTWRIGNNGRPMLLLGPDVLLQATSTATGELILSAGSRSLPAQYRLYSEARDLRTDRGRARRDETAGCWIVEIGPAGRESAAAPALEPWRQREENVEPLSGDSGAWTTYPQPLAIERLPRSTDSQYAWYRTRIDAPMYSTYTLRLGGIGDRMWVFLNGRRARAVDGLRTDEISFVLPGGRYDLAFLVEHDGRDGLGESGWRIPDRCRKGLQGPAALFEGPPRWRVPQWWFVVNDSGPEEAGRIAGPVSDEPNWQALAEPGPDDMGGQYGFAWYLTRVRIPPEGTLEIFLTGVDDRAWVYLDSTLVGRHDGARRSRVIRVPETVPLRAGTTTHTLAVCVENRGGPGGLTGPVRLSVVDPAAAPIPAGWRMRAGLTGETERWFDPAGPTAEDELWQPLTPPDDSTAVRWYRTAFDYSPAPGRREALYFRTGGLRRGVAWLNGRRLGRYRRADDDAQSGFLVPTSWLNSENRLVVAETDAGDPTDARLEYDAEAGFYVTTLRPAGWK